MAERRPGQQGMDRGLVMVAVVAIIGLLVLAMRPTASTSVDAPTPDVVPPPDGTAVVASRSAPGGLAPFGIRLIDPTHTVAVVFVSGPDCAALLDRDDRWPSDLAPCTGGPGVEGVLGGTGILPTGESLVRVVVTVDRECFAAVEIGMPWPTDLPECAPGT